MATYDFVGPLKAGEKLGLKHQPHPDYIEGCRIASTIDLDAISINWGGGPIGGHGFRTGWWQGEFEEQRFSFYASVPHGADMDQQLRILRKDAARALGLHRAGYCNGTIKMEQR